MAIETRTNDTAGREWLAAEEALGSYMLVNERTISKLTGEDAPEEVVSRVILIEEFRKRFTDLELFNIVSSNDPVIGVALLKLNTKKDSVIDLDDPAVIATIEHLKTINILTAPRAAAMLA